MNARTLAATLFGVGGVWMLAELLVGAGTLLDPLLEHGDSPDFVSPGLFAMLGGYLIAGLGLLLGRNRLAAWLFEDGVVDVPAADVLLDVGFRIAGVMIVARGLESIGWHLTAHRGLEKVGAAWTYLAQGGGLVLFGLILLLGARTLVGLLGRARKAGLGLPEA